LVYTVCGHLVNIFFRFGIFGPRKVCQPCSWARARFSIQLASCKLDGNRVYLVRVLEPILRLLNSQLQRHRCCRQKLFEVIKIIHSNIALCYLLRCKFLQRWLCNSRSKDWLQNLQSSNFEIGFNIRPKFASQSKQVISEHLRLIRLKVKILDTAFVS
jgi:hypothetical protein